MKVLHVVSSGMRRGAEVFASDLVRALDEEKVSQAVAVLNGAPPSAVTFDAPIEFLETRAQAMLPGLRINLGVLAGLRTLSTRFAPSVVQAHGGEALKYSLIARPGAPVVYRRIGAASPWIPPGLRRRAYGVLMRRAARIVAVAEEIRRETVDLFDIPSHRVVTIPNGVDVRRLCGVRRGEEMRRLLGIDAGAPVVLSLMALSHEKDPLGHLEVAARALEDTPGAVYLVAGDGSMRERMEQDLRRRGLDGRVLLLGNRPDVGDLLRASDVLLLASSTEGMPACLIEAGTAAVPAVAYALGGIPEVVLDGTTGLLAPPGDAEALSARLIELIRDEDSRRAMGRAASEWCRSRFDMATVATSYLELYDSVSQATRRGHARPGSE